LPVGSARTPVLAAAAVVLAALTACAIARIGFWSYGADAGTFAQLILDAFGGMRDGIEQGTHFRYHWSPTLVLLWPLLALTHSVLTLQLVQAVAVVAVAPLVHALAAPRVGPRVALLVALLALIYPPLLALGFEEFHELGLLPLLALGLLVAADRRRWGWFWICAVLLCGLREDVCLELAAIGAGLGCVRWRSARAWWCAALLAAITLAVYYGVVVPTLGGWVPAHFYRYPFADGPAALLSGPLHAPLAFARTFATVDRLTYLLEAFVPLAFLPLRTPWVLASIPGFAIVLLANDPLVYHMGNHYAALWVPWLLAATAFAARGVRLPAAALALSVLTLLFADPMHPAHFLRPNYRRLSDAERALRCVPDGVSVSTHDEWFTHIAARDPHATLGRIDGVDALVFADDFPNAEFQREMLPRIRAAVARGEYRVACRAGNVVTYLRTPG
jgi:uncharacterized membrane protein